MKILWIVNLIPGKAAEALRDCWTALGKWNGKQSKKQEAKVKEVKALLE